MALAGIITELLDVEKRENALRCLSGHLIEVGQIRPEFNDFLKDVVRMDVSWISCAVSACVKSDLRQHLRYEHSSLNATVFRAKKNYQQLTILRSLAYRSLLSHL